MDVPEPVSSMQDAKVDPTEKPSSPANGHGELDSEEGSSMEEAGFNWGEYLEETGACAAPPTSFRHVEISIQSNFQPGMKLEVATKGSPDTYWVATVITTCGQLLLLRYCGYGDDRRADFWCDVLMADLHPVGWCTQNSRTLRPPDAIKEKYTDWTEFLIQDLTGSRTAPASLLEGPLRGKASIDLITVGSLIELQDTQSPFQYWIVSVIENVGGRLRLRYVGLEDTESYDQWLFYLDYRLRPVGWCQENKYRMDPPSEIYPLKMASEWKCALEKALVDAANLPLPMEVFKDHADLRSHVFTVGMKLEAVNWREPSQICPASVTKVFNNHFFQVTIDDLCPQPSALSTLCHADSLGILPAQWCLKNGVTLTPPKGYPGPDFDWAHYHKLSGTEEAPAFCFRNASFSQGFTKNMKLEAVNPRNPRELCVASVVGVRGRLLWLHLEGLPTPAPEFIVDVESMDIFPVGWCEANSYPLTAPLRTATQKQRKIAVVQPEKQPLSPVPVEKRPPSHLKSSSQLNSTGLANGKYSCPKLFINHRCFSGPFLNKGRLAELPRSVGPGKCVLVLKEVLSMIINAAYKPGRVLRELQLVKEPHGDFQEETLKAKYRGRTYRAVARIVRTAEQVADFCRRVCAQLECCPNLLSPVLVADHCPENCSVHTKTRYTYYYGKRKRVVRPSMGECKAQRTPLKPARRRKRRRSVFMQKKRRVGTVEAETGSGEESEDEEAEALGMDSRSEGSDLELPESQVDETWELPSVRSHSATAPRSSSEPVCQLPPETTPQGLRAPPPASVLGDSQGGQSPASGQDMAKRGSESQHKPEDYMKTIVFNMRPWLTHPITEPSTITSPRPAGPPPRPKEAPSEEEEKLVLDSNPLEWTVTDVVRFIKLTDCAPLAKIFQEQDIDGQALLLLTLPTVQECLELKLGPAIKLCHQIERVKGAFYAQFAG